MLDLLERQDTHLSVFTPLDAMFAEYRQKRADIDRIADFVQDKTGVMGYFIHGAQVEHQINSFSASTLFDSAHAIRALDAEFWSRTMALTDVLEAMNAAKRNEWHDQIHKHKTVPFEPETVISTVRQMLAMRETFFAERVAGLFHNLSDSHVTNTPQGFNKRMIIDYMLGSYGQISHERAGYVHDLRCVIAKFSGRDAPGSNITHYDLAAIVTADAFGKWHAFDGGAFSVRLYKKGTAHLEVHPDIAWKLNQILAFLYPAAIPESFRRKPAKAARKKVHDLAHDLIPFDALCSIELGRISHDGYRIWFPDPPKASAVKVLEYIGGVKDGMKSWLFDYKFGPVLNTLRRTGGLPERVTHQFHQTREKIACIAVDMAEIGEEDTVIEPSAGQGAIADHLPKDRTTCVEVAQLHCAVLQAKGFKTVCADFMEWNYSFSRSRMFYPQERFDRCVMNPPFSDGRAVAHVTRAAQMLAENGILVAVMPASYRNKEIVAGMSHEWSDVFADEFEGTGVSVSILKLKFKGGENHVG